MADQGKTAHALAMQKGEAVYLEDLSVGLRFVSRTHPLDEAQILAYAKQFDPQPFHTDPEAARDTFFGGLAASGWHTASLTMRLLLEGGAPFVIGGLIGGGGEINWPRPTRAGDILRVESEILEVTPSRSKPDRGIILLRSVTLNQKDEPLQVMTVKVIVPKRTPG